MSTLWVERNQVWYLECQREECTGLSSCIHSVDEMMSLSATELLIPTGRVSLPMAGEFPELGVFGARVDSSLTGEKLGSFKVDVSRQINSYGTRKISITTPGDPVFLMMMNPEDAIVSIYTAMNHFIKTQVVYGEGDRFGNCRGASHTMTMQTALDAYARVADKYPMLKFWDLVSKLTTNSCVLCMWKRHEKVTVPDANASGLGSL